MAKEELLEFDGTVSEVLPDGNYRVKLDNDHVLLAYMSGKMRKFPEIDRAEWFDLTAAREKIIAYQLPFLDELESKLAG